VGQDSLTALSGSLDTVRSQMSGLYSVADDTRTIIANSYLELQQIEENTGNSAKYLRSMQEDLYEVRQNTSRL
ncbi:MAG: hypothetical protein LUI09_03320, partial [Prevotellaceae bacterium]|nr:hypothetical protein [Prevotellaceae bacterium]